MSKLITKADFLADLRAGIQRHRSVLAELFRPLDTQHLAWQPQPKEWSIVQCFDHLNLTHDYYRPKIAAALAQPARAGAMQDGYVPSFWGRIYMHFAFNPRYSFPTAEEITPQTAPQAGVLDAYLARQDTLEQTIAQVGPIDLRATRIPIARGVAFNLGDCLKILVYHDALHIGQAQRVLAQMQVRADRTGDMPKNSLGS
ncbi:MAG: hypothetical protein OHK0022_11560 [Roseiflexaceae bacterium]